MHSFHLKIAAILVLVLISIAAAAMQHEASFEKGKALFSDKRLGTSGNNCNDCHKDGAGLEKAVKRTDLAAVINACITGPLKGKPLEENSVEIQSLILFLKSFSGKKQLNR